MVTDKYIKQLQNTGWPQEFHEKLHVGNLRSNVGIATLWTYQEVVHKELDPDTYAVVGNFYDRKNGLEPFIRNCLANPNIRHVILLGNDKAKSREVLVNFFEKGFKDGQVTGTDSLVPPTIPLKDLEELRKNVTLYDLTEDISNLDNSSQYAKAISGVIEKLGNTEGPYAKPRFYEKPVLEIDSFPSEKNGFVLRGETIGDVWLKILRAVYDYGIVTQMKHEESTTVRLCQNLMTVIANEDPDKPDIQEYFRFDEPYLKSYYHEMVTPHVPEGTIYTYGSRLRAWKSKKGETVDQIADVVEYLKKDTYRTSAIAQTWIVEEELTRRILNKDKNSPCIVLIQPYAPEGVLTLTAYIRSNDMFRAWPLNAFGLRKMQKIIAEELDMKMGSLTTISCSAHIYEDNWEDTKEILEKHHTSANCFYDPRGYYTIALVGGSIQVKHFSPDSQLLKEYEGVKAREINDTINSSQHPIDSYHSSYLGEELMKAEIALQEGARYTQDQALDLSQKI